MHNITDAKFFPDKKILPFFNCSPGIVIAQPEVEYFIENRPQHAITTAVTEIDIPLPEPAQGKPRRRQGANKDLFGALGNKNFVRVAM
jgi:hypothetical protein